MTGARASNNPWKSLAAKIILRAKDDYRGAVGTGISDRLTRALLQYDAERWLNHDPWCQYLLDCALPMEYDPPQSCIIAKEHRWRDYRKYLPDIDPDEQLPIHALAEILNLNAARLNDIAYDGRLAGTQKQNGIQLIWCTSITEIAKAVATGNLILSRK